MKFYRNVLINTAIIVLTLACSTSSANAKNLTIDGEHIPPELLSAYGHALIQKQYNCKPLPYEAVRDRFVQSYITANHFVSSQFETDNRKLLTVIAPHQKKIEQLEKLVRKHADDSRIKTIYQQQIHREKRAIQNLRDDLEEKKDRLLRTRIDKNSRLAKITNISEDQKIKLKRMVDLERQSRRRIQDSISDKAILERYKQLIKDKDSSLVSVYAFKERTTIMGFNDPQTVAKVKALMINNATGMEIGRAGGIITAWSMRDGAHWSAYNAKRFQNVDPSKLTIGDFIGPVQIELRSSNDITTYSLTYIADKKHYPVIGFDQEPVHRFSAENYVRQEELKVRQAAEYKKLRSQIEVVEEGELVVDAQHDLTCKYK